jgi:hypothetical protein
MTPPTAVAVMDTGISRERWLDRVLDSLSVQERVWARSVYDAFPADDWRARTLIPQDTGTYRSGKMGMVYELIDGYFVPSGDLVENSFVPRNKVTNYTPRKEPSRIPKIPPNISINDLIDGLVLQGA